MKAALLQFSTLLSFCIFATGIFAQESSKINTEINEANLVKLEAYKRELENTKEGSEKEVLANLDLLETKLIMSLEQKDLAESERNKQSLESYAQELALREQLPDSIKTQAYTRLAKHSYKFTPGENPWAYYKKALNILANSTELSLAREQYFSIFQTAVEQISTEEGLIAAIPKKKDLDRLLKIAKTNKQKAFANHLTALSYSFDHLSDRRKARASDFYEEAIKNSTNSEELAKILLDYALWSEKWGKIQHSRKQRISLSPDYSKAIKLYQRILSMKNSPLKSIAENQIKEIKTKRLSLRVENTFFPGTETFVTIRTRNLSKIKLRIYPLDIEQFSNPEQLLNPNNIQIEQDPIQELEKKFIKEYDISVDATTPHYPLEIKKELGSDLSAGSYLVEAHSNGVIAKELLFITNNTIVLRAEKKQLHAYLCKANNGDALIQKKIKVWVKIQEENALWKEHILTSSKNGMAKLELPEVESHQEWQYLALVMDSNFPAMVHGKFVENKNNKGCQYAVHLVTNAKQYIGGDHVSIKGMLSCIENDSYQTLADKDFNLSIYKPSQKPIFKDQIRSNHEGIIQLNLELIKHPELGEYICEIRTATGLSIYKKNLFRIQNEIQRSYHFRHIVKTGKRKRIDFYPGERIRSNIKLCREDGTPLSNKSVELIIEHSDANNIFSQKPFTTITLTTDKDGKADYHFTTDENLKGKFIYTVSARVFEDSQNRLQEIAQIYVHSQAYNAQVETAKNIYKKDASIDIYLRCISDSNQAIKTKGELKIVRDVWEETWINSKGERVSGDKLRDLDSSESWLFWKPSPSDYYLENTNIIAQEVKSIIIETDEEGKYTYSFDATESGYYRVIWFSRGDQKEAIQTETDFWVISDKSEIKDYRPENLQVISNSSQLNSNNKLEYLLSSPIPDISILVYIETTYKSFFELVKLSGYSALKSIKLPDTYTGQVRIHANAITNGQFLKDIEELEVTKYDGKEIKLHCPEKNYQPGDIAKIEITLAQETEDDQTESIFLLLKNQSNSNSSKKDAIIQNELSPFLKKTRNTRFSFQDIPFYTPNFKSITQNIFPLNSQNKEINKHFLKALEWNNTHLSAGEKIIWHQALTKEKNGVYSGEIIIPNKIGTWSIEAFSYNAFGKLMHDSIEVKTKLPVLSKLTAPAFLNLGDTSEAELLFINNQNENSEITIQQGKTSNIDLLGLKTEQKLEIPKNARATKRWNFKATDYGFKKIEIQTSSEGRSHKLHTKTRIFPLETSYSKKAGILNLQGNQIQPKKSDQNKALIIELHKNLESLLLSSIAPIIQMDVIPAEEIAYNTALTALLINLIKDQSLLQEELEKDYHLSENLLQKKLDENLEHLFSLQNVDGSWGWLPEQEGSPRITANILWSLHLLKYLDYQIPNDKTRRSIAYISNQLLREKTTDQTRLLNSLTSRNIFKSIKNPSRLEAKTLLKHLRNLKALSLEESALLASSAMQCQLNEELSIIEKTLKVAETKDIQTQSIELLISIYNNSAKEETDKQLHSILEKHEAQYFRSRLESLWLSYAVYEYLMNFPSSNKKNEVIILTNDGEKINWDTNKSSVLRITEDSNTPTNEAKKWTLSSTLSENLYYRIFTASKEPVNAKLSQNIAIAKQYIQLKQIPTLLNGTTPLEVDIQDDSEILIGEEVLVEVQLETATKLSNVTLIEKLPAGFLFIESSETLQQDEDSESTGENTALSIEKNMNQLNVYLSSIDAGKWVFSYKLKAETAGNYQVGMTKLLSQFPETKSTSKQIHSLKIIPEKE